MKKILIVFSAVFLLFGFGINVRAAAEYTEDYGSVLGGSLDDLLDGETKQILEDGGIDPEKENWVNEISAQGVFGFIASAVKNSIKKPLKALFSVIFTVLICAAADTFSNPRYADTARIAATAAVALLLSADVFSCVTDSAQTVKACAAFMVGFIPVFTGLVSASGGAITATAAGASLLVSANAVSSFAAFAAVPFTGGYLSVSIAAGVSPLAAESGLAEFIKRITLWILSLVSSVFLGVLSVQTAVNSAADGVAVKTAKFILGTSVPVAGGVLSEAVSTVSSSLSLLKSSVGIYAVCAVCALMLPCIIRILLWRAAFAAAVALSALFGQKRTGALLKAVDGVFACLLGFTVLTAVLFIISLTVLVSAGGAQ